jgi:hypothetical protein
MTTPSHRSSSVMVQDVQQADGRHEIVGVQVNIVPVSPADEGNMNVVVSATLGLFNDYTQTMNDAEIIEALRYAADRLEARQR